MLHAVPLETGLEPFPGYRLKQLLGYGSFGEVWEAEAQDGTTLALKFLPAERDRGAPAELRSLQSIRQLNHPNLTRVFRVWCHLGYIVVAMERADGSLTDLAANYRTEMGTGVVEEHACLLLSQVAAVLDFLNGRAHRLDGRSVYIQHRDVKPSNMLLFGETVKLTDFGLSALLMTPGGISRACGTPAYAPPEVFRGRLARQSDQYSLAVTYCELRGGRLPYEDVPDSFASDRVLGRPNLDMLSRDERPIVARALAPVPEERWPSCVEFLDRLAHLLI